VPSRIRKASAACGVLVLLLTVMSCYLSPTTRQDLRPHRIRSRVRFGQSVALSDLDGDNRVDKATLGATGFSKSIRLDFGTQKRSVLLFDTSTCDRGSLVACDIDNDGDIDLVWTDLIHPDQVVVWLNDGAGEFQPVYHRSFATDFVVDASGVTGDSTQAPELALYQMHPAPIDQALERRRSIHTSAPLTASQASATIKPSSTCRAIADRGPPKRLSANILIA
jgi:hypothetical protein